jgi:catechol 2,3-dioxygenase-like lactoylglutathione lyase family enzyme
MSAAVGKVDIMDQRVSLITLGVRDVATARAFYERLGWRVGLDVEETVFFQTGASIVVLWGPDKLEKDSGVTDGGSWGGITLAHNVGSRDEVDRVIEEARAAGARIGREPAETFYG